MLSRTGCAGLCRKCFCFISCGFLPTTKIGTHFVYVCGALRNNMVQAGLVFDIVLYLPSISCPGCFINTEEILQKSKI